MSTSAVVVSERCFIVARISWRFDGNAISASGTTGAGGVNGLDGEYASFCNKIYIILQNQFTNRMAFGLNNMYAWAQNLSI